VRWGLLSLLSPHAGITKDVVDKFDVRLPPASRVLSSFDTSFYLIVGFNPQAHVTPIWEYGRDR
jgi:hypothetical protein